MEVQINGDAAGDSSISLGERVGSVSMGVAQSVSGAAGLAIGAPIAVADPDMRRSYSEQSNQLMRAVDNAVTAGSGKVKPSTFGAQSSGVRGLPNASDAWFGRRRPVREANASVAQNADRRRAEVAASATRGVRR
jgi:hypothetical protein